MPSNQSLKICLLRLYAASGVRLAFFLAQHLDDVPTVIGLHRLADLANMHAERGVFERLEHRAAGEPAQIAALIFVRGVG